MRCRDVQLLLDAYVGGDLTEDTAQHVQGHLKQCRPCRSQADVAHRLMTGLKQLSMESKSQGFDRRLLERLSSEALRKVSHSPARLEYFMLETSLGKALVAHTRGAIVRFALVADEASEVAQLERRFGLAPRQSDPSVHLRQAVLAYVESAGATSRPRVSLARMSSFQRLVLEKVDEIKRGSVRSYQWVAREVGHPRAARAVGMALGQNPVPVLVPCHRVVRADGSLGGYSLGTPLKASLGTPLKARLLELEGLTGADVAHSLTVLYGRRTTGIFCFPTCAYARGHARRPHPENVVPFRSAREAWAAGYRPCLVCRPA